MNHRFLALPLITLCGLTTSAEAETPLTDHAREKPASALPLRGQSMTQVQSRLGEPARRLDPRGGQKPQWPTIERWVYPSFTVYFEKRRVIDAVANR